jgi:para-nitrobenzyl esterase
MFMKRSLLGCLAFLVLSAIACANPQIAVESGRLEGLQLDGVRAFFGIPYAAPPVGELRWRSPQPAADWSGVRNAKAFSASCMQSPRGAWPPYTHEYVEQASAPSEDCLTLNVWVPETGSDHALPILVWIHGGAFIGGASSVPIYDGAELARTGIVVVSINYRVGAFGFFTSPELRREDPQAAGVQGILDVVAALHWLRRNAAAFGGDADRITIAGQSAGAAAVNILLVSPAAAGMFHGAVSQSMPLGGVRMCGLAKGDQFSATLADTLGADSLRQLQSASPTDILEATWQISPGPMAPVLNQFVLPEEPLAMARKGHLADGPIMAGVVADESRFRGSLSDYRTEFAARYGGLADELLRLYTANDDDEAVLMATAANRDRLSMGLRQLADAAADGASRVFLYRFNHREPGPFEEYGVFHSSEIPYVFGTLDVAPERPFTPADYEVARRMRAYWSNFVKHGDPNAEGLPAWPGAGAPGAPVMLLGEPWLPTLEPSGEHAEFYEAFFRSGGHAFLF